MKTVEPDSKSIIRLGRAKQAVEKHMSDLLAVNERNEDLEQSFFAEIAIVEKLLKTVKETKGNKSIVQTGEHVERSENEESDWKVDEREFNVLTVFRATDLMFKCGLTYTAASRKAVRGCVNVTSILICWT